MFRRIFFVLITIPLAIVLIALTVANRTPVPLSLDIFNPGNPALTMEAPLFVWLFAAAAVGVVAGGIGTWLAQGKHRTEKSRLKKEERKLRFEMEDAKRKVGKAEETGNSLVLQR